jgi:tryptophan-rich sensory protein
MKSFEWYAHLVKPSWAPPSWLFGPVWAFLYVLIAISYGYVGYLFFTKKIPFIVVLPFILNLIFNAIFTPLQFGLRSNVLAMVDILLVLGTLVWAIIAIYPHAKWVSFIQIPYLGWVIFATVLQITITVLNF